MSAPAERQNTTRRVVRRFSFGSALGTAPVFPDQAQGRKPKTREHAGAPAFLVLCDGPNMFTGLVELKGVLARRSRRGPGYRLTVESALGPLVLGESISVSGACLTVVSSDARAFEADVSLETAQKTTLGALPIGGPVNLERALKVGDRLGGHLVSGHVDAVAELVRVAPAGEAQRLSIAYPHELARFIAVKGSITLDGVSLTVNAIAGDVLEVMVIPHTLAVTTLGALAPGAAINLEVDTLARYAVRFLEVSESAAPEAGLKDALRRAGFEYETGAGKS